MQVQKNPLTTLSRTSAPLIPLSELIKHYDRVKDGALNITDPQGGQLVSFAARYATAHGYDCVRISSGRFASSSSYEYEKTVFIINADAYEIPKEVKTATFRTCSKRNITYFGISEKNIEVYVKSKSSTTQSAAA